MRVISEAGSRILSNTSELDYLTHIVFRCVLCGRERLWFGFGVMIVGLCRLFENTRYPVSDPRRMRVEVLFSPGAAWLLRFVCHEALC